MKVGPPEGEPLYRLLSHYEAFLLGKYSRGGQGRKRPPESPGRPLQGADHENPGSMEPLSENDVQQARVAQFRSELSDLLSKYGYELSADYLGEVSVSEAIRTENGRYTSKTHGYWGGTVDEESWHGFQ